MRLKLICFFIVVAFFGNSQTASEKVIAFAKNNMGKKVERGECWDLANAALNKADANWTPPFGFGEKFDYKKQVLMPGDILQMTNVKFIFKNGSASFPKHTAIIYKADKNSVTLIHQNFNNKRFVDTLSINLENIKNGKIEAFRPKAK